MRLWTLHPKYLDQKGLVALWREALLARAVLRGKTRGYRHHPQLDRFKRLDAPLSSINSYLSFILYEADLRGYKFDSSKIGRVHGCVIIDSTDGQLAYEWKHLLKKLKTRNPAIHQRLLSVKTIEAHPSFNIKPGPVEYWEHQSY